MKQIYLDHAATTPVDPAVLDAMLPYLGFRHSEAVGRRISKKNNKILRFAQNDNLWGNPGSIHSFGQAASAAVFKARQSIARAISADYKEIIFTGSATEANNLALQGAPEGKIVVSAFEHDSVFVPAQVMVRKGRELLLLPVSKSGQVNAKELEKAVDQNTAIVSVMYANNEVGAIQNIKRLSRIVKNKNPKTLFHTDAVQAFQYLDCNVQDLEVDLLTLSAHKLYGPKGIGLLYVKKSVQDRLNRLVFGGEQEQGLRSGTENVAAIVGFALAIEMAQKRRAQEAKRAAALRDYLWTEIKKAFPRAQLNGALNNRLPNNLNFYIPGLTAEEAIAGLDLRGIAISAGPACSVRALDPSRTLLFMGFSKERAKNSLRVTLGKSTAKAELNSFIKALKKITLR